MAPPLGSFAEWQRAQPGTPRSALADLVRRAVGSEIVRADRILDGYSNEVHRIRCATQQEVIVRILRFDDDVSPTASEAEAGAIERARAVGVPAPEILLLDTVRIEDREFPVMIQRPVGGQPLSQLIDRLSPPRLHQVLTHLGALIARLNQVRIESDLDWSTAMAAELADRRAERDQILASGFSAAEFDHLTDLLDGYVRDDLVGQWVLCHGDLSCKHIYVSGDRSTARVDGIIDFGDWKAGAPVHDLAVLRAREPQLDLSPILAGYGAPTDEAYRRRLDLHTLIIAVGSLAFGVNESDQACIARSARQVRTLVRDLDSAG